MLRKKLMRRGLARVISLALAVSLAMPGSALAAATQASTTEMAVEDVCEAESFEDVEAANETAEDADTLTEADDPAGETPAGTEDEEAATSAEDKDAPAGAEDEKAATSAEDKEAPTGAEDEEAPAAVEDEGSPVNPEEDSTADATDDEAAAVPEEEAAAVGETAAPADQEEANVSKLASQKENLVTSVEINTEDYTTYLGLNGANTYQMDVKVTYDTSTSYEANQPIYFRSSNENVLTVDDNGLVTAVGTGYAYVEVYTITEYQWDDEEEPELYEDEWDSQYFEVVENVISVKFDLNGGELAEDLETESASTYKMYKDGTIVTDGNYIYLRTSYWKDSQDYDTVVRDGYKFEGWTETKDGTEVVDNYYYPSENVTLYAKWEEVYTVKFDLNGGELAEGLETEYASTYKMYKDGTEGTANDYIYLRTSYWKDSQDYDTVVRDGYKFEGWTETKDGTETVDNYYYPSKNVTLYAKWDKIYTIKFDLNGGQLAEDLETEYASTYKMYKEGTTGTGSDYIYLRTSYWKDSQSYDTVVRDGYRFDGWTETKNGTEVVSYYYTPTKDVTLYAKWTQVYTVKFDTNSGAWSSSYYESEYGEGYIVEKGESFYLPDSYDVKRSGYKLIGWTTTKNGTPVLTGNYTATKNITLYAKWAKTYKVTFNAGDGYFGSDTSVKTKVLEIETGKDIGDYLSYSSYTPSNGSKVFLGWYKDSALKTPVKKSDTITKDSTFYAKYETKVYKVTVTNLKGASYTNRATGEYIYGDKSTATSYDFYIRQGEEIGYMSIYKDDENARLFFDKDCKTKPYYSSFVPTGNITVYAKWYSEVTITWDAAGGSYYGRSTGTVSCKKNLMCENLPTELTKTGYYFVGWYDAADTAKKVLPASHVFKANTTVKAKWATGIKITFKSGGGKFSTDQDPVIYIKAKTSVGEKMDFSVKREGYTLTGWKSSATGKVVSSMYNEKPAKDTTYTAVWTKDSATTTVNVTLIAGDGSIYDWENERYVAKLVVKVPKNSTLGDADFYFSLTHDEPYKNLHVNGWSTTKTGSALKASYTFTKDVTLYPVWDKYAYLTVALVTNGGAVNNRPSNSPRLYRAEKDTTISLPTGSNIEKEGFTFAGWYTDPSFKTKVSTPDKYKVTKSCYLYAKWTEASAGSSLGKTTRGDMFNLANNVKVTWQAVPGAKYYKVYREGVTDSKETQKDPVIVTTGLVGWDKSPGLTNGHAYRYKIVASTTGAGDSSGDSSLSYSKLMYRLKTVVIRSAKNTAAGVVTVTYDKTTSGDSYVLQYCEREDMVGAKTKVVLGAGNTSYKISGLKKGKTYYISIRVRKKVDGIDYYTTFGVPKKVKIEK